ncbi:hypothetical protein D3C87_22600 [compost metagenome]
MRYTKYFSSVVKQFGTVNLNQEALQTFLNIVHLEAELKVYERLNQEKRFVIQIHSLKEQLKLLTEGLAPKILMKQLHSENYSRSSNGGSIEGAKPWDEHDIYLSNPKKRQ